MFHLILFIIGLMAVLLVWCAAYVLTRLLWCVLALLLWAMKATSLQYKPNAPRPTNVVPFRQRVVR
jgi:hypothetical protein